MFFELDLVSLVIFLLVGHVVGDYILQNDFMAKAKNHNNPLGQETWKAVLPAHAVIHAGLVYVITGSVVCFLIEAMSHACIDYLKCDRRISFYQDQVLHLAIKGVIVLYWVVFL